MARQALPENGILLAAVLLLLGLAFGASWIAIYVQPGSDPWAIVPWFLLAAVVILVVGIAIAVRRPRRARGNLRE